MKHSKKTINQRNKTSGAVTKQDIHQLSKKMDGVSTKIDRNQKTLDQIDNVARILIDNEQNLKDLGGLKHRLDTLDNIMVTVDKIAGSIQTYRQEQVLNSNKLSNHEDRLEKIEKNLNFPTV